MNIHPSEYVITKFPIIPPIFRPIYPAMDGGSPMVSDLNHLYRDLINVNNELHGMKDYPDAEKKDLQASLSKAVGAIVGTTEPINVKSQKQELKGALPMLTGNTAKDGYFHRKILYRTQDATGRGTILPDPTLSVDEVKLPKEMMMEMFKPFLIKNLVMKGYSPVQATKEVIDHTQVATKALEEERTKRPVLLNRAPTLHKYNMMAFKPIPVEGKSIFIPPLVLKGFAGDFDGDSVSGETYVLVSSGGNLEVKKIKDV